MTPDEFREMALSFPDTSEGSHMGHFDFRVRGKVFATVAYPDEQWAMVKLTPDEQKAFVTAQREMFVVVKGDWGLQGYTNVRLAKADKDIVRRALAVAWEGIATKRPAVKHTLRRGTQKRSKK